MGDNVEIQRIRDCYVDKKPSIIGEAINNRYSIIIPIIELNGELQILFEVRAKSLRSQPGEIAFPGGKIEFQEDPRAAGVRELCEELGLFSSDIEIIGSEDILVTQHNRIIYCYIGLINSNAKIIPSPAEVDHIFTAPLSYLQSFEPIIKVVKVITEAPKNFPYMELGLPENYKWLEGETNIYFYYYMDYTIWGLTAKILNNFMKVISDRRE